MQSREDIIKNFQEHGIPFEPVGEDVMIVCVLKAACGGVNHDIATLRLSASAGSGTCESCRNSASLPRIFTQLGIGEVFKTTPNRDSSHAGLFTGERTETAKSDHATFRSQLIKAGDILTKEFPDAEWLVDDMIPLPSIVALSGMPGHGKTFVTIHIAMCVSRGMPVFGKFPCKQAPVLVISEEDYPNHLQNRFQSLGMTEKEQITYLSQAGFKADNKDHIDQILGIVQEEKYKLVIIDSMRRIHDQDENDSRGMAKVAEGLKRIARVGVAVLYTHHHRKQEDFRPSNPSASLRGSTEIQAALENHFALEKKDNEDVLVFCQPKSRNAEALKPFEVKILKENFFNSKKNKEEPRIVGFDYIGDHDEKKSKSEEACEAIITLLKSEGPKSRQQMHDSLKPMGYGQKAIDNGIHDAEAKGEIELVPKDDLPPELKTSRQRHYRIKEKVDALPPLEDETNVAVSQPL